MRWLCVLLMVGCVAPGSGVEVEPEESLKAPYLPLDDVLRLNHVQAKGTHNSYHVEPDVVFHDSHRYSHAPLDVQLRDQGVRQLELDLHYREDVGFEIFHLPGIDEVSTCVRFVDCLQEISDWSQEQPGHLPVMIWLEPKDDMDELVPSLLIFDDRYDELEEEILSVFDRSEVLTPDDVRGDHPTLPAALRADGWPTLGEVRGKVMFSLLDTGRHRDIYVDGVTNLAGKLLFVGSSSPEDDFAAMFKINDANSESAALRVAEGFLVTSNLDGAPGDDAADADELERALPQGVHFLGSDFPAPSDGRDYFLDIPEGTPARCNPVTAPPECEPMLLEDRPLSF